MRDLVTEIRKFTRTLPRGLGPAGLVMDVHRYQLLGDRVEELRSFMGGPKDLTLSTFEGLPIRLSTRKDLLMVEYHPEDLRRLLSAGVRS